MNNLAYPYTQSLVWLQTVHQWMPHLRWTIPGVTRSQAVNEQAVQQRHLAFHDAYQRFVQAHPDWAKRGFNEDWLRRAMASLWAGQRYTLPSGLGLARQWDEQFGMLASTVERARQMAMLASVADHFLFLLEAELGQLADDVIDQPITSRERTSIPLSQRLTTAIQALRRLFQSDAQPSQLPLVATVAAVTPETFRLTVTLLPNQPGVALCAVTGKLDRHSYATLIGCATDLYQQGHHSLLLDLRKMTAIELSGLFALHNIARLFSGKSLLDPELSWDVLRTATEESCPEMGQPVKVLATSPTIITTIRNVSFCSFLEIYADVETTSAAFVTPINHGR